MLRVTIRKWSPKRRTKTLKRSSGDNRKNLLDYNGDGRDMWLEQLMQDKQRE